MLVVLDVTGLRWDDVAAGQDPGAHGSCCAFFSPKELEPPFLSRSRLDFVAALSVLGCVLGLGLPHLLPVRRLILQESGRSPIAVSEFCLTLVFCSKYLLFMFIHS